MNYTVTADYEHLDEALNSYWQAYLDLKSEFEQFVPLPLSAFDKEREKAEANLVRLNPNLPKEELRRAAAEGIAANYSPKWQFFSSFANRIMTLYVTVALLSQALCEAEINAILAVGLYEAGQTEKFEKIERSSLLAKWVKHPKLICKGYELHESSGLYESLAHLIAQRNSWIHHKVELCVGNEVVVEGSSKALSTYQDHLYWIRRYFCLPYDLVNHIFGHTHQMIPSMMLYKRKPIPVADEHKPDIGKL